MNKSVLTEYQTLYPHSLQLFIEMTPKTLSVGPSLPGRLWNVSSCLQPSLSRGDGLVRALSTLLHWRLLREAELQSGVCRHWMWIRRTSGYLTALSTHFLLLTSLTPHPHSSLLSVYSVAAQWSCRHCSQINSCWAWRSESKCRITCEIVSSRCGPRNQAAIRTSRAFEAMPWSTSPTSSPKDRWTIVFVCLFVLVSLHCEDTCVDIQTSVCSLQLLVNKM